MMASVTATAAVASSSVAIRSFRAHKPSLAPDLDEVGRRSTSCRSGRGRAAPPMAARPRRRPDLGDGDGDGERRPWARPGSGASSPRASRSPNRGPPAGDWLIAWWSGAGSAGSALPRRSPRSTATRPLTWSSPRPGTASVTTTSSDFRPFIPLFSTECIFRCTSSPVGSIYRIQWSSN
ncbi:uncharacterized protein LOC115693097 isoform X2 [Syzygium oleosum]|uniref:uncharacterized protein LOC115693097 isoform X2 n=1 Tax=Syzygium oleosum TaxID=219896 RepID=UPI0024B9EBFF|nr:uncharacterized protein LOC115693097 isoform X2 [Syzygium oleosum]